MGDDRRDHPDAPARPYRAQHDSLGWTASGTTAGKRANVISGVSGRTLMDLQAHVFARQDAAKRRPPGPRTRPRTHTRPGAGPRTTHLLPAAPNRGLEARRARDLDVDPDHQPGSSDGTLSAVRIRAALERKARRYDRLAGGDGDGDGDGDGAYAGDTTARFEVDFLRKYDQGQSEYDREHLAGGKRDRSPPPVDRVAAVKAVAREVERNRELMREERGREEEERARKRARLQALLVEKRMAREKKRWTKREGG